MVSGLADAAGRIERHLAALPVFALSAFYNVAKLDPTAVAMLFTHAETREKVRTLETALASDLVSCGDAERRFPDVFYIAVNAHYDVAPPGREGIFMSDTAELVMPGVESRLKEIHIELCRGAGCVYVPDDRRFKGDLVMSAMVSSTGRVRGVEEFPYNHRVALPLRRGDDALRAIGLMSSYMEKQNNRLRAIG